MLMPAASEPSIMLSGASVRELKTIWAVCLELLHQAQAYR